MKLRYKIALFVVLIQIVLISAITIHSARKEIQSLYEEMSSYAKMMAKVVAVKWISDIAHSETIERPELERFIDVMMSL